MDRIDFSRGHIFIEKRIDFSRWTLFMSGAGSCGMTPGDESKDILDSICTSFRLNDALKKEISGIFELKNPNPGEQLELF